MSAPPYQKLFWGSYHKHTAHLSHAREHGAYLLLIAALWNNDGRLPADDETLAAFAKLSAKEWEQVKPRLMPLFRIARGKLTQPRVTEDLARYRDTSGKRKQAGKTGGTVSARNKRENRQAIATNLPTKPEPEPNNTPPNPPKGRDDDPPGFAEWWARYPRKVARGAAVKAYRGALKRAKPEALLGALTAAKWPEDERYIPHASTWLNGDRWLDGQAPSTNGSGLSARVAAWGSDVWAVAVRIWREDGSWDADLAGPEPGQPGCCVPAEVLRRFGIEPAPLQPVAGHA